MGNFTSYNSLAFFDVETISLDTMSGVDTLLSISIIKDYRGGDTKRLDLKIKMTDVKRSRASSEALKVNMYSDEEWQDAVELEDAIPDIVRMLYDCPIVAHNISFDIGHLTSSFEACGWTKNKNWSRNIEDEISKKLFTFGRPLIDTYSLAWLYTDSDRQNLNELRSMYNISTDRAHAADTDTEDCRTIFYNIIGATHPSLRE